MLYLVGVLDRSRAWFLRCMLSVPAFRIIFKDRVKRQFLSLFFSIPLCLVISLFIPIWPLVLGPLVLGVPHIFSSLRYTTRALKIGSKVSMNTHRGAIWIFATISFCFALIKIASFNERIPNIFSRLLSLEMTSLCTSAIVGLLIYQRKWKSVFSTVVLLGPVFYCSYEFPFEMIGVLAIAHNFVAFIFWFQTAITLREKRLALLSLVACGMVSLIILLGTFDLTIHQTMANLGLESMGLKFFNFGKTLAPYLPSPYWPRLVVLFAFTQMLHYLLWIKVIPEAASKTETPVSFRSSLFFLKKDFGLLISIIAIGATLGSIFTWTFFSLSESISIYIALAGYHGFLELATLPLTLNQKSSEIS